MVVVAVQIVERTMLEIVEPMAVPAVVDHWSVRRTLVIVTVAAIGIVVVVVVIVVAVIGTVAVFVIGQQLTPIETLNPVVLGTVEVVLMKVVVVEEQKNLQTANPVVLVTLRRHCSAPRIEVQKNLVQWFLLSTASSPWVEPLAMTVVEWPIVAANLRQKIVTIDSVERT